MSPITIDTLAGKVLDMRHDTGLYQDTAGATPVTTIGQSVARWEDQSGSGNHAMQATAGSRPSYQGAVGVRFSDDALIVAAHASLDLTSDFTIFAVLRTVDSSGRLMHRFGAGSPFQGWGLSVGIGSTGIGKVAWWGDNTAAWIGTNVRLDRIDKYNLVTVIKSGGMVTFYNNGMVDSAATASSHDAPAVDLIIGASLASGASDGLIADWQRLTIFDRALDAAELANAHASLISGYAVDVSRPNAATYLLTPTYDGSNQATHPDVIYFADSWHGYAYWMALTPYPNADVTKENPSILVSNDGNTWIVPPGSTNPIDPQPGSGYNSDNDLFMEAGGLTTMWCVYRYTDGATLDELFARSTTDGITWSGETSIFSGAFGALLSPAIVYDGSQYVMWVVDSTTATPNTIRYYTASAPTGPWSAAIACTLVSMPATKDAWHLDVIKVGSEYRGLLAASKPNAADQTELFFMTSPDGATWTVQEIVMSFSEYGKWDSARIYRATMIAPGGGLYDVWYGGRSTDASWHIGRMQHRFGIDASSPPYDARPYQADAYYYDSAGGTGSITGGTAQSGPNQQSPIGSITGGTVLPVETIYD